MQHAIFFAPFGELADPQAAVDIAVAAEECGWDGVFLWDHIVRDTSVTTHIGDAFITLAAIASRTSRIAIGPMVTPLIRRRPQRVAREAIALDRLSDGRFILGLGLGVNSGGELERFGEEVDAIARGAMLDEGVGLLRALLAGDEVNHTGSHYTAHGVRFEPGPIQQPLPMWFAARGAAMKPVRRAAQHGDGLFAIDVDQDGLAKMIEVVQRERGSVDGFEIVARVEPGRDASEWGDLPVTWVLQAHAETDGARAILNVIEAGPPR
jgi:alkanesulfonate monooxygenase SsuD/methylene tetrahydromethanopterin reductase-like flavin-dependent oxidoreductase (luciferase family)